MQRPRVLVALLGGLLGLGLACGARSSELTLRVLVDWDPEVRSACVRVKVSQDGGVRQSSGIARDAGHAPLVVAVFEDGLGELAEVQALGFLPDCQTALDPPEASAVRAARFGFPDAGEVSLRLRVLEPPDGGPPDGGPPDGGPPDGGPSCPGTTAACQGLPPRCQDRVTCPDGTCALRPSAAGASCEDGLACTTLDACDGDGGCAGAPVTCPVTSGSACLMDACLEPGGCAQVPDPLATCTDANACTDNDVCLADGGCGGAPIVCPAPGPCQTPLGCDAGACVYGARTGACDGGTCNTLGQCVPPTVTFPYVPSNFTEAQLPPLSPAPLTVSCAVTIDTHAADGGVAFTSGCGTPVPSLGVIAQGGGTGPTAALLFTGPVTLEATGFLTVTGDRPLIIVVKGDAALGGLLTTSAGADRSCAAPPFPASFDGFTPGGGGGGGFGAAGSGGGISFRGGVGQGTSGNQTLVPLRGGCSGGLGGPTTAGGPGGGAVQLSATGTVVVDGVVSAAGGGGAGAPVTVRGGGGGGSGGGILLEALQVTVGPTGVLAANGGGGGEGSDSAAGIAGQPGMAGTVNAPGGTGGATCGGAGGRGGSRTNGTTSGSGPPNGNPCFGSFNNGGGGGGGGGVGRIRVNSVNGCAVNGLVSPAPTGC